MTADAGLARAAKAFPIGQKVKFYPVRDEREFEISRVRSEPWRLGHGAIVVKIEGRTGGVSVHPEHLTAINE